MIQGMPISQNVNKRRDVRSINICENLYDLPPFSSHEQRLTFKHGYAFFFENDSFYFFSNFSTNFINFLSNKQSCRSFSI